MYENYEKLRSKYGSAVPADCCDPILDVCRDKKYNDVDGPMWDDSRFRLMSHLDNGISNFSLDSSDDRSGIYKAE